MSCTPVTPEMAAFLEILRGRPAVDVDELRHLPEWAQAVRWGWVMQSGELPRGLVRD